MEDRKFAEFPTVVVAFMAAVLRPLYVATLPTVWMADKNTTLKEEIFTRLSTVVIVHVKFVKREFTTTVAALREFVEMVIAESALNAA